MKRVSRKGFTEEEWTARRKEQKRIINKKRRETHSEEIIEYRETHKEETKEYNQTPAGIKSKILNNWNIRGITFGDMSPSDYYDNIYLPALKCMACNKNFNKDNKNDSKCTDHKHDKNNPCNVRGVICFECNLHDNWKKRLTPDSIYQLYL